ncbi:hypothetical protein C8J56DRAFT_1164011 [Mycena floridula]|nr:hypothetical protein C8J56DRAFT_1164011 [Mycena floridula]
MEKLERPGLRIRGTVTDRQRGERRKEDRPQVTGKPSGSFSLLCLHFFSSFLSVIRRLYSNVKAGRSILLVATFHEPYLFLP